MDFEVGSIGWALGESLANVGEGLLVNTGVLHLQRVLALEESGPGGVEPVLVERLQNVICLII